VNPFDVCDLKELVLLEEPLVDRGVDESPLWKQLGSASVRGYVICFEMCSEEM
jgi:hypothetical protein